MSESKSHMLAVLKQFVARLHAFIRGGELDRDFGTRWPRSRDGKDENIRRGVPR